MRFAETASGRAERDRPHGHLHLREVRRRGRLSESREALNSPGNEGDFYVARDEAFIVFGSPHRGGFGGGDLFISFTENDGSWSDPKNLGATINTPGFEFGPYVTDDRRYLFYSSSANWTAAKTCKKAACAARTPRPAAILSCPRFGPCRNGTSRGAGIGHGTQRAYERESSTPLPRLG
jgi:hypothetical protein